MKQNSSFAKNTPTAGFATITIVILSIFLFVPLTPTVAFVSSGVSASSSNKTDPPLFPATLTSPNALSGGNFGFSVAISGTIMVVGAPREAIGGAGQAYIINLISGIITTLTSPNSQTSGEFGYSVAVSGTTVVVGAPDEIASGQSMAGHAYTFNANTGALIATLTSPKPQTNGFFGSSVAVGGSTVIVGAFGETASGFIDAGHAYTFTAAGTLIKTLVSPTAQAGGNFGFSAAISGTTLVVGARLETVSGFIEAGRAYTFSTSGTLIKTFASPHPQIGGDFGWSVAISGATTVIGAWRETVSGHSSAGHAYTFGSSTGSLIKTLASPKAQTNGFFGYSVAISGTTIVAGAYGETVSGQSNAGHAYTFSASGAMLKTFTSSNAQLNGNFGSSVAVSSSTIAVGGYGETASGLGGAGHAYAFKMPPVTLFSPNAQVSGVFGNSVAAGGSIVVVGAPGESVTGMSNAGRAYIFNSASEIITTLTSPNAQSNGLFGVSVATDGTAVVVGAPQETASGLSFSGHAYIFNVKTGSLIATLTSPNAQTDGFFGNSVSMSSTTAVVGAPQEIVSTFSGAGHAYTFSPTTGTLLKTFTSPNAQNGGEFGSTVAISGTTIFVGAPFETVATSSNAGHAYAFSASAILPKTFTSPNAQVGGEFGISVAISGTTVLVGAGGETVSGHSFAGRAYIFNSAGTLIKTLTSPRTQSSGSFGNSVALSGTTIIVGAAFESVSGHFDAGRAYMFSSTGALLKTFTSPNVQTSGMFGWSVGISGTTRVVGAPAESASGFNVAGHAYVL